jgi:hypothetical protein
MIRSRDQLKAHLESGGAVRCELRHEPEPKTIWSDPRNGQSVHGSAVKWAQENNLLRPLSDGLFQDTAQTFIAA